VIVIDVIADETDAAAGFLQEHVETGGRSCLSIAKRLNKQLLSPVSLPPVEARGSVWFEGCKA